MKTITEISLRGATFDKVDLEPDASEVLLLHASEGALISVVMVEEIPEVVLLDASDRSRSLSVIDDEGQVMDPEVLETLLWEQVENYDEVIAVLQVQEVDEVVPQSI